MSARPVKEPYDPAKLGYPPRAVLADVVRIVLAFFAIGATLILVYG